jgi:hypothetical protein
VRVVKGAIQEGQNNRATITRHQNEGTHRTKEIFWPSVYRLAATNSFSAQVVILRITDEDHARRYATACRILFNRCQAVLTELERHFPAL